jgi:hypothetical protein
MNTASISHARQNNAADNDTSDTSDEAGEPIHSDPLLAEVFELLHRMAICREDTPATRMARTAIIKLTAYEARLAKKGSR